MLAALDRLLTLLRFPWMTGNYLVGVVKPTFAKLPPSQARHDMLQFALEWRATPEGRVSNITEAAGKPRKPLPQEPQTITVKIQRVAEMKTGVAIYSPEAVVDGYMVRARVAAVNWENESRKPSLLVSVALTSFHDTESPCYWPVYLGVSAIDPEDQLPDHIKYAAEEAIENGYEKTADDDDDGFDYDLPTYHFSHKAFPPLSSLTAHESPHIVDADGCIAIEFRFALTKPREPQDEV